MPEPRILSTRSPSALLCLTAYLFMKFRKELLSFGGDHDDFEEKKDKEETLIEAEDLELQEKLRDQQYNLPIVMKRERMLRDVVSFLRLSSNKAEAKE
jgi:hypothetical protein